MIELKTIDMLFIAWMRRHGLMLLRVAVGIVFLWFGALKIFGVSPVADLVMRAYPFFPEPDFMIFLGLWEIVIGAGLLFKVTLRATLALLWLQMFGTFTALVIDPSAFFIQGNILLLTAQGEFVVKNLVFVAASIVIGGNEIDSWI